MQKLIDIMRRLRAREGGCPWDRAQNFETIAPHTIEEAYEVADAIERGSLEDLKDELGDLLFQVVFHSQMAAELDAFGFDDVVQAIVSKMVRRHPHVFGDLAATDAQSASASWENIKAEERRTKGGDDAAPSALDGVTVGLPEVQRAQKLQRRAARVGFDWNSPEGVRAKLDEELAELDAALTPLAPPSLTRVAEELGDVLFTCVNLARHYDIDAARALRGASHRFEARFRNMEAEAERRNQSLSTCDEAELERLWSEAKRRVQSARVRGTDLRVD